MSLQAHRPPGSRCKSEIGERGAGTWVEGDGHQDPGMTRYPGRRAGRSRSVTSTTTTPSRSSLGSSPRPNIAGAYARQLCQTNPGDVTWECPSGKVCRWVIFWAGVLPALRPVPPLTRGFASTSQRRHHRICLQGRLGGGHHAVFLYDAQMDSCAACNGGRKTGQGIGDTIWRVNHPGPRPPGLQRPGHMH
jgi:hypothetical protein